jgi:hypothetical protein
MDMGQWLEISFDCLPLRSVGRFDPAPDAPAESESLCQRLRQAAAKHGLLNSYYLDRGCCRFHFTNDDHTGIVEFGFRGTALTDARDMKTLGCDLEVELAGEVCDWLTAAATAWLTDCVRHAVPVEFDRFIAAGDLRRTVERLEKLRAETEARGGFLGMDL